MMIHVGIKNILTSEGLSFWRTWATLPDIVQIPWLRAVDSGLAEVPTDGTSSPSGSVRRARCAGEEQGARHAVSSVSLGSYCALIQVPAGSCCRALLEHQMV